MYYLPALLILLIGGSLSQELRFDAKGNVIPKKDEKPLNSDEE